mmetsp:Transcript_75173/g.147179  ORF Transcript_75173/g.147179 Transcript_75173/m.147179 type:complete len:251 (+) Transcript_75173:332-1084(+)
MAETTPLDSSTASLDLGPRFLCLFFLLLPFLASVCTLLSLTVPAAAPLLAPSASFSASRGARCQNEIRLSLPAESKRSSSCAEKCTAATAQECPPTSRRTNNGPGPEPPPLPPPPPPFFFCFAFDDGEAKACRATDASPSPHAKYLPFGCTAIACTRGGLKDCALLIDSGACPTVSDHARQAARLAFTPPLLPLLPAFPSLGSVGSLARSHSARDASRAPETTQPGACMVGWNSAPVTTDPCPPTRLPRR